MTDPLVERLESLIHKWRAEADRSKLLQGLDCAEELDALLCSLGERQVQETKELTESRVDRQPTGEPGTQPRPATE